MSNWLTKEKAEKTLAEAGIIGSLQSIGRGPLPWIGIIGNIASIVSLWFNIFPQSTIIFAVFIFTAIIMLPLADESNSLRSIWWSLNTPSGRKEKSPPTQIPIGHGIAGKAFAEMKVYVVGNVQTFPGFVTRDGGEPLPYTSVISCPFRIQGEPAGVLNIDCKVKNAFEPEEIKFLVQAAADTLALLLQVLDYEDALLSGNF